jgi:hypothetical protein
LKGKEFHEGINIISENGEIKVLNKAIENEEKKVFLDNVGKLSGVAVLLYELENF